MSLFVSLPIKIFQKSPLYIGKLVVEAIIALPVYTSNLPYSIESLDEDISLPA